MEKDLKKTPKWVMIILAIFSTVIIFLVVNIISTNYKELEQTEKSNLKQSEELVKQTEGLTESYEDLIDDEVSELERNQIESDVYGIIKSVLYDYTLKLIDEEEIDNCYYINGSDFDFTKFYGNTDQLIGSILINDDSSMNIWLSDGYVMITGTDDNFKITLSNKSVTTRCNQ